MTTKKNAKSTSKTSSKPSVQAHSQAKKAPTQTAATPGMVTTFESIRQEALAHEAAGRWSKAAESWAAAEELTTKKAERQEAAGRAAAARVRAEAARSVSSETAPAKVAELEVIYEEPPVQDEVETVQIESTPAAEDQPNSMAQDAPAEDSPTAPQVTHDAPSAAAVTTIAPATTVAPTGETGATIDGTTEPPVTDATPATETADDDATAATEMPATETPATEAPITEALTTKTPAADATPTTETLTTETPAADATPSTEPSATEAEKPSKRRLADDSALHERDERLPPIGTVLRKLDRHGNLRCECIIEQDGIRYSGSLYKSLTAAAIAACRDLGLKTKTVNGWLSWGVAQTARAARPKHDGLASLQRAFERYLERAQAATQNASSEERAKVQGALQQHASALLHIASETVPSA